VNEAEKKRDARIARWSDTDLLRHVLHDTTGDARTDEKAIFQDMLNRLCSAPGVEGHQSCLSTKQRSWAEEVARRITPIRAADAPVGRAVETPAVLQNLPKSPPGRTPR
jgi:hypothetical protein